MIGVLRVVMKIVFAPVWLAWQGYRVLWWAFADAEPARVERAASLAPPGAPPATGPTPAPSVPGAGPATDAPRHGVDQNASFEVVDTTPGPEPEPTGTLRGGFAAAMGVSLASGWFLAARHEGAHLSAPGAWTAWAWATLLAAVASVMVVRAVVRRQRAMRPMTTVQHARAVAGGVSDAAVAACKGVVGAGKGVGRGAAACARGVRAVAGSSPVRVGGAAAGWVGSRVVGLFKRRSVVPPTGA